MKQTKAMNKKAETKLQSKELIEETGMKLTDEEMGMVSGGTNDCNGYAWTGNPDTLVPVPGAPDGVYTDPATGGLVVKPVPAN